MNSLSPGIARLVPEPFPGRLLEWYAQHARRLPWRGLNDPYAIWVAEVMLQQTRIETVIPYFERWMQRFPTIESLAKSSLQEVLSVWEGLGYYGRARNLLRASQVVMHEHGGQIPTEVSSLRKLPGIGRYTAAAIASIAFNRDEATLDGNIRRVLARYYNVEDEAQSARGKSKLWNLATQHLPEGQAGTYNQALMDLGAGLCTPKNPDCNNCPLMDGCQSKALGIQEQRPILLRKESIPHYLVTAAVIKQGERVLITRRPPKGLLGGLWEFPGGKQKDGEDLDNCLKREIREELGVEVEVGEQLGVYKHAYTHFRVTLHAFHCHILYGEPRPIQATDLHWVMFHELLNYPMGKLDRQISKSLLSSTSP